MVVSDKVFILLGLLLFTSPFANCDDSGNYLIGAGIADITGPAADLGMMGYAAIGQNTAGIHTRLFARAYIISEPDKSSPVVFVSSDLGMVDQAIKTKVVEELQRKGFGEIYTTKNVLLSGTHTHSGPAGYIQYVLYGITSMGFSMQNFNTIVNGIVQSIERAHKNLVPGHIFFNKGDLSASNVNRSPSAYNANPDAERNRYTDNVDKEMTLLKFVGADGTEIGSVNWFAVHPTSMQNTNHLISGDNKGYAEMLFEYAINPNDRPGKGKFVAAFASSNLGDVSPNTDEAKCTGGPNKGLPCDFEKSTCPGLGGQQWTQLCVAIGPGTGGDMFESTEIIGRQQFVKAKELYDSAVTQIRGTVKFIHQYVNMTDYQYEVVVGSGVTVTKNTCKAALGYSFAGGTTDGPGAFNFFQGNNVGGDPFWDFVRDVLLKKPSDEQTACHSPKPILLNIGEFYSPYEWAPSIVETQILKVGNLFITGIPGELTTMAGRRLRETVVEKAVAAGTEDAIGIIAGLSNVYTHYITTEEEYGVQRYEGASTIYGPNTLGAYLDIYGKLITAMLTNAPIEDGPLPPNLLDKQISLVAPIIVDTKSADNFGDVTTPPSDRYTPGDLVSITFQGGHPRNDPMREGTFFVVEKQQEGADGKWDVVATDADWSTRMTWDKKPLSTDSKIIISWQTKSDEEEGIYRIRHFGYYKPALRAPKSYQGSTDSFEIAREGTPSKLKYTPKKKITSLRQFWNVLIGKRPRSLLNGERSRKDSPQELSNFM